MGNCNPPYKNGVGDLSWCGCSCSDNGGGCFKPECYESVLYNYSCSNTCSSFSGMNFIFYAIHGCNRAKYKFYIGEYDSNGKWNDAKKIFVANINLNSGPGDAPNALPSGQNPYPCPGPPNPDGLSCCIPSGSTLSVQEVTIGGNIINNLNLKYTNDDCVQIPVKIECDTPGGCHSDATQCIILTSDKSCCLGTGAFDSSKPEPGNPQGPVGVNTVDLCCKPCLTGINCNDTSLVLNISGAQSSPEIPGCWILNTIGMTLTKNQTGCTYYGYRLTGADLPIGTIEATLVLPESPATGSLATFTFNVSWLNCSFVYVTPFETSEINSLSFNLNNFFSWNVGCDTRLCGFSPSNHTIVFTISKPGNGNFFSPSISSNYTLNKNYFLSFDHNDFNINKKLNNYDNEIKSLASNCSVEFSIGTTGCCLEYLSGNLIRAVGDGAIFVTDASVTPTDCCKNFSVSVNNKIIYSNGNYNLKTVKDGDNLIISFFNDCGCNQQLKQPEGYSPPDCSTNYMSKKPYKILKTNKEGKYKILFNNNFFRK